MVWRNTDRFPPPTVAPGCGRVGRGEGRVRVNVILHPYYWARRKIPLLAVMVGSNSDRLEMAILTNIMNHGHGHDTREVLFVTSKVHRRFCMSNRLYVIKLSGHQKNGKVCKNMVIRYAIELAIPVPWSVGGWWCCQ